MRNPRQKPQHQNEMQLLQSIDDRLGVLNGKMDDMNKNAIKTAAKTGAVAGSVSGGIVAVGIALLKAKFGIGF